MIFNLLSGVPAAIHPFLLLLAALDPSLPLTENESIRIACSSFPFSMPAVIDVSATDDPRDIVHRAVQALAEGKLIVFPTETVYVAAASVQHPVALARLTEFRSDADAPLTLALRSSEELSDYVPGASSLTLRLARRCWPGPVILEVEDRHVDSILTRWPKETQQALAPQGSVRLRVASHPLLQAVQRLISGPLAIASFKQGAEPHAVTGQEAIKCFSNVADLILDDGRCRFGQPSSVVRVDKSTASLIRPGVISETNLRRLASWMAVVVCTGNTCRSPMGEMLLRKRLSERLQIPFAELDERGIVVMSAGVAAPAGECAAEAGIEVMKDFGLDLSAHETQPVTDRLIRFADLVLTMTRGHRDAILSQWPEAAGRVHLLSRDGGDVGDPVGGPLELYRRCALQIDEHIKEWVEEIELGEFPGDWSAALN